MEETRGRGGTRWGTAIALLIAVVFLSVFDSAPLVMLPLALVLVAIPAAPRWRWFLLAALFWLFGVGFPGGPLPVLSRTWALLLGSGFLLVTLARPRWGVFPRALLAVALAGVAALVWVAASGGWGAFDHQLQKQLMAVPGRIVQQLKDSGADSAAIDRYSPAIEQAMRLQWRLLPGLLGLQSLAALALASWLVTRLRRGDGGPFILRPLREFRFNDQLVWILIAGIVLLLVPVSGSLADRVGLNALVFMAGLYALRGLGVFLFLVGGAPSFFTVFFGAMATLFLYPLVLTAAVLIGLGDTWIDVRARAPLAPRT
ncbi:MAG TPA: DUF2232 domain-containing protein [Longimicrobiaceae bacterium]|nr:DUF2232 domain-containing protein [Longimicrobiaceae bacterium]